MPYIETHNLVKGGILQPDGSISHISPSTFHQLYNGLDCCVTGEVWEELGKYPVPSIYHFEKALQGPYLEMINRGFLVDQASRANAARVLRSRVEGLEKTLDYLARGLWGKGLNPRSPLQLKDFFYKELRLPEVWLSQKGERKLSTNREALEKLDSYLHARPFISSILSIRDIGKQLNVFESEIDPDGRFRTSYNIAGTETGRPSSSTSAFGTGGNAQNISPALRYVFVADPGYKIISIDLEQVEARDVGFFIGCLFDDWEFLNSCESGDLHTTNAKRIWPDLGWTGDKKEDRSLADKIFYREFSYRDMAKRGSHLSNYSGTAYTAARSLKVPQALMDDFQARYCRGGTRNGREVIPAYPGIPRWWEWTATQLEQHQEITTPFGRKRNFFGRPNDPATLREAIAFLPQSTTADRMNLGLWRIWKNIPQAQLLAQTYDSVTFQVKDNKEVGEIVKYSLELLDIPLYSPSGRRYSVPGEAKIGWNWGGYSQSNPEGLAKWRPDKPDDRVRRTGWNRLCGGGK